MKDIILKVKSTEKNGKVYKSFYLIVDLDYTTKTMTWDKQLIAELLGISVHELILFPVGNYVVGAIDNETRQKLENISC